MDIRKRARDYLGFIVRKKIEQQNQNIGRKSFDKHVYHLEKPV